MKFLRDFLHERELKKLRATVDEINQLEKEIDNLSDQALKEESEKLKSRVKRGESLDDILPRAFALVRESSKRTLGQRPFDVQLMGGIALHKGQVAEMVTGEGKTLAAVAPAYLNTLTDKGVHIVTVNEYLARRDAVWMGQIYHILGLSVSCLVPNSAYLYDPTYTRMSADQDADQRRSIRENLRVDPPRSALLDKERDTTGSFLVQQDFLRPISRREAYLAHITYGTNHEFGFDYLRDNLAYRPEDQVQIIRINPRTHQRESALCYAIIDEVDSILIDESRTPLIIAAPDEQSSRFYKTFARVVQGLKEEEDYTTDEKHRAVSITDPGIEKVERMVGINNLYASQNLRLVHYLEESLKARVIFKRDKDYVVRGGEVIIVDEFTGRMLLGRRYSGGLHQAIEAKEGVLVKEESRTYAKISIQNYFRLYEKIAGMTGTAQTSAEEFHKVYNLDVITIPTNRPLRRKNFPDIIYKTPAAKWQAAVQKIKEYHQKGQPVLVGTTSIEKNELIAALLSKENIPHEVLNAKNNEREGQIIAQAGRLNAVTVATNMAGRGVDIILGGNPPNPEDAEKIKELGGLHVIGTERHEARRIDNQLRGRAGRQGDPGSSQFFLSLEDDLVRIFGGDRIKNIMERFKLPDDMPIEMQLVSKAVVQAQAKVEGMNFDIRKHLLEYDDILNKQRTNFYKKRQAILESSKRGELSNIIFELAFDYLEKIFNAPNLLPGGQGASESQSEKLKKIFEDAVIATKERPFPSEPALENLKDLLTKRSVEISVDPLTLNRALSILDMLWMTHLENLEALQESVSLRAYGQKDPLSEYREESRHLFGDFWLNVSAWVFMNLFKLAAQTTQTDAYATQANAEVDRRHGYSPRRSASGRKIGRNDPCPCGSGKKYKRCHGA